MANTTSEKLKKLKAQLPEGWKLDTYHFFYHQGEKRIFIDSTHDENGSFYRLELEYKDRYHFYFGKTYHVDAVLSVDRYTPCGKDNSFYSFKRVLSCEGFAEPVNRKVYSRLVKIAADLDVVDYFKRAAETYKEGSRNNDIIHSMV